MDCANNEVEKKSVEAAETHSSLLASTSAFHSRSNCTTLKVPFDAAIINGVSCLLYDELSTKTNVKIRARARVCVTGTLSNRFRSTEDQLSDGRAHDLIDHATLLNERRFCAMQFERRPNGS